MVSRNPGDPLVYLTLPYLTPPYLTPPYLTPPYLTPPYLTLPLLTLPYVMVLCPTKEPAARQAARATPADGE